MMYSYSGKCIGASILGAHFSPFQLHALAKVIHVPIWTITIKPHNQIYCPALVIHPSRISRFQFKDSNIFYSNIQEVLMVGYCSSHWWEKMKQSCHKCPNFQIMSSRISILHCMIYNNAWKASTFGVILVRIFPHSIWMRENTDQNNSE